MENKKPSPQPCRLLRMEAVENLTGLRKSSIYTYMASKAHGFPTPVRLGSRCVAWRETEVLAWIGNRQKTTVRGTDGGAK